MRHQIWIDDVLSLEKDEIKYRIKHDGTRIIKITKFQSGDRSRVLHPNNYPQKVKQIMPVLVVLPVGEEMPGIATRQSKNIVWVVEAI